MSKDRVCALIEVREETKEKKVTLPSQIEVLTAGQLEEAMLDMPDASQPIALSQNRESLKFVARDKNARDEEEAEDIDDSQTAGEVEKKSPV